MVASRAQGRGFKLWQASPSLTKLMCDVIFLFCHDFYGDGKQREVTCVAYEATPWAVPSRGM